jgi:hypothetical protein
MGATLAKLALGPEWADLSRPARLLLTHMAVTALDNGERPRLYYAGHDALATVLFGDSGVTPSRLRRVRRYVKELIDAGAIEVAKRPTPISNAHYFLILERRSLSDLRSDSGQELTQVQKGPMNVGPITTQHRSQNDTTQVPSRPTEEPKDQQKNHDAGRPADAVSSLVTSSSEVQTSPYLGEPTRFDGFGIGKNEKQDQKRLEEPRCKTCGVAETRHHQWTNDTGDPHPFTAPSPARPRQPHPRPQKTPKRKRR